MPQSSFDIFKQLCDKACHERHACAEGYKQMLASENVSQMMATWRDNWQDVVESKYADIICAELPKIYPSIKEEMNKAGIYLNECPDRAFSYVRVLITHSPSTVSVYGYAKSYVLGNANVIAYDHAQVYNSKQDVDVTLYDYSYGYIRAGRVTAYGHSDVHCACDATLDGAVTCSASGGTVNALAYRHIEAYGNSVVYALSRKKINISGNAVLKLKES